MKRLWICLALLLAVFSASLFHVHALGKITQGLQALLVRAEAAAHGGDWDGARQLTEQAEAAWQKNGFYLHVTLRHDSIDQIHSDFKQAFALLDGREIGEYSAVNARLIVQFGLLYEMEQLTVQNIL